jgi:iron-sulfur cluster assembly protein
MSITLTERAVARFTEQLEQRGKGIGILVGVKKTGCSGYAYTLEFADLPVNNADFKNYSTFTLFVDPLATKFLEGITIDYVKSGLNERFEFINPNETGRCGCGESFTV